MSLNRFFSALSVVLVSASIGYADCPYGDALWNRQDYKKAEGYYMECAKENDSDALYKLGIIYRDGYVEGKKDVVKGLSFLRFSAENGYAPAQRELGELLIELERSENGRTTITEYQGNIQPSSGKSRILGRGQKMDISPYAWILLAAEKAENKWYYPSKAISDKRAVQIIRDGRIDDNIMKKATTEAGSWKMNKLRSAAKEILSSEEYRAFERAVFSGQSTPGDRASAMGYLKQKIETRKK